MFSNVRIVLPDEDDDEDELGKRRRRIAEEQAVKLIQRFWWTHIRKRLFKLLKHTIRAAEHCISHEILKRVSPLEAELLKEPTIQYKVRFRFAGSVFPPFIVFKIFCTPGNQGSQYMSGKTVITSTTKAAVDACKLMGYRKYYNQMVWDELQYKKYGIIDEIDIATIRDHVQYISRLDETPANFGGRHNYWRKLSLEHFPRTMIMYDIMDYAQSGKLSERLRRELPFLLLRPQNEEVSRTQFLAVCQIRSPTPCPTTACLSKRDRTSLRRISERRSFQARQKVSKMRKVYKTKKGEEELNHPTSSYHLRSFHSPTDNESLFSDEDWEQEAVRLYDWARSLRSEDIEEG
ncbi:uncharacterized protein CXorf58 homolog [Anolis carolinensis]|uniref:Uncharacterized protein n=1 Tax=Anolis carolinensis TaxID=28377 RepID=G1KGJ0_ANOCA|nr:PREDICTED: putative uncharacterized protein CXorf58 homolog [Anolis carolinensis]|eukprot:XP_003218932.1 PREDICTED: putative uncharacterized protein CXorf58 homolog [Anolis carolinensis]